MRDITEEVHQEICGFCDIDGWCLSKNQCPYKVDEYYCSRWEDRYDSTVAQKLEHKIKMTLHTPQE